MTELIVVIAVIGIIMAVSVPTLWTYFRTATLRGAAEELVTVLNGARQLAIRANSTVCVTNDGTRVQYHLSTCGATTWKGPGTDSSGNITLSNSVRAGGSSNVCYSYLGATTATPAPCVKRRHLNVTNPAGGSTMSVTVATTGRAKIQVTSAMPSDERGLTLVEILIALVVISVGLVGIAIVVPVSSEAIQQGGQLSRATFLAEQTIEQARLATWTSAPRVDSLASRAETLHPRRPAPDVMARPPPGFSTRRRSAATPPTDGFCGSSTAARRRARASPMPRYGW